jgi:hypothetical protein
MPLFEVPLTCYIWRDAKGADDHHDAGLSRQLTQRPFCDLWSENQAPGRRRSNRG